MTFSAKDVKIMQKRNFPPGQHGASKSRPSEYGIQLREKQRAKVNYGIQEKQFAKYFYKAIKQPGVTGDILLRLLELRLDNLVFRLGFAETRTQARQLVNHGFFEVNGKKVDIPSFAVKVGDSISVRANKVKSKYMQQQKVKLKTYKTQEWLQIDPEKLSGKILASPEPEMIGNTINTKLIVEHYSRT